MASEAKAQLLASLRSSIAEAEGGSRSESPLFKDAPAKGLRKEEKRNVKQECDFDSPDLAYKKILRMLGYCDRTVQETRAKLLSDGYSTDAVEAALERAIRFGLLNDQRFTETYIDNAFRSGKGKRMVSAGLKKKGISDDSIALALEESSFSCEDESERAYDFLLKHPPRGKNVRDSAFRKLINKGYSVGASSKAASKYCENNPSYSDFENN